MNERDFAYWLNGFVEMNGGAMPTAAQWKSVQDHLALVFKKVTPPVKEAPAKTESQLEKHLREYSEKQAQWPTLPTTYPAQPYWLQPGMGGIMPGTVICSVGQASSVSSGLISC